MPFIQYDNARLHYELQGPPGAPMVVFSNSLGTDLSMWDGQAAALTNRFRVLRYDTRGHGQTSVTPGPYRIEQLAGHVIALLDSLEIERAHFCGLSMGGQTGLWLGIHHANRIDRLMVCNTGAKIGNAETWAARIDGVRKSGMKAVAAAVMERFLSPEFRERCPEITAALQQKLESTSPQGYVACCEAIRDADLTADLGAIRSRTLVITGSKDPSTPPPLGQFIRDHVAGAQYAELPSAHLSNIEAPTEFNAELVRFLT
jgi:3-oxoadipate enol-lactonase